MADLSTTYLGLLLKNPLVVASSPLSEEIDRICQMRDAGASAVVLSSLFEEQFVLENRDLDQNLARGSESFPEALSYFPDTTDFKLGPDEYLEHIRKAKKAVDIPIIASLNGVTRGGWIQYAKLMEEAGANALELNIYHIPTNPDMTGSDVENMYLTVVKEVKKNLTIPLAVKIGHSFSAIANMAKQLSEAGADGVVLFNRFYQPDFNLEELEIVHKLTLSSSYEALLRFHWAAILHGRVKVDIAVSGGIHTIQDVLKSMMAGAKVAMMASVLLKKGISHLAKLNQDLEIWMEEHEYHSIRQMQGSMSQQSVPDPRAFERANYMKVLRSFILQPPFE